VIATEIDLCAFQVFYANIMPLLDDKASTVIFANVEDILLTNTVRFRIRNNSRLLMDPNG